MLQLLRRGAVIPIRGGGGHGWARPDVPLQVPYVHKRKVDIFDSNMWFYCNIMPEYFINQNEMYLRNAGGAAKQFMIEGRFIALIVGGVMLMRELLFEKRVAGLAPDAFNKQSHTYSKKVNIERPFMKKHFLDLNLNGDSGIFPMTVGEKTYLQEQVEMYEENRNFINLMNNEGKTFIERVEKESKQIVLKRHGIGNNEHHHH